MNESLSEATAEAIEDFYSWVADMPLDEAMTALQGLREYQEVIMEERDIELGWHKLIGG